MPNYIIGPLHSKVGIQRDSTVYHSVHYVDGQWCRFYDNEARKMAGYKFVDEGTEVIIRTMFEVPNPDKNPIDPGASFNYFYLGRYDSVKAITFDYNGNNASAEYDRTPVPTPYFDPTNTDNLWCFDQFTDSTSTEDIQLYIVAQVAPNGTNLSNQIEGGIFYGPVVTVGNDALIPVIDSTGDDPSNLPIICSGGIVYVSPILVAYGNGGLIRWTSSDGLITSWPASNTLLIANSKIIKGANSRGGTLFWTLDSLVLANPVLSESGEYDFTSQVIEPAITVLSAQSIVSFNQVFYWVGTDQFYSYSGIVQKVTNTMNQDWFFNNINLTARAKVWAVVIGRYSEIWWFYPRNINPGDNQQECNAAVIYNVELNVWYDTLLNRSTGLPVSDFPYPVWASSSIVRGGNTYPLYMHEIGFDEVDDEGNSYPIQSYFQTHLIDLFTQNAQQSNLVRNRRIAPDFVQLGAMEVQFNYQNYPYDTPQVDGPYTFYPPSTNPSDPPATRYIDFADQGALVSFTFSSNTVGGYYQGGKTLFFYNIGDTLK